MRVDTKPFTDKRVRQALACTIDRPALSGVLQRQGRGGQRQRVLPALSLASKDVPQRTLDIDQAKQLWPTPATPAA